MQTRRATRPAFDRDNLDAVLMKLKYWLVLLLAVILPLKGAMASAAMLCHSQASQQVVEIHEHEAHSMHNAHSAHASHVASESDSAVHQHSDGADTGDTPSYATCLACAAVCGASPLPVALSLSLPVLEPARDWRGLALLEPPDAVSAGLERPPRSI